jgi:hypothetical protein
MRTSGHWCMYGHPGRYLPGIHARGYTGMLLGSTRTSEHLKLEGSCSCTRVELPICTTNVPQPFESHFLMPMPLVNGCGGYPGSFSPISLPPFERSIPHFLKCQWSMVAVFKKGYPGPVGRFFPISLPPFERTFPTQSQYPV